MNRVPPVAGLGGLSSAIASNPDNTPNFAPLLVIIDMQPGFPAAQDALTQWFVRQEIECHIEQNLPVLLVEFDSHEMGESFESIRTLVESYKHGHIISKSRSDGSAEILAACSRLQLPSAVFRICGVNSDACVLKTVQGLLSASACRITIPQDACNSVNGKEIPVWSSDFPALPRVTVELHGQRH